MIRERMRIDRFRTWIGMAVLLLAFAVSPAVRVQAAQITIDGDPQEWTGVDMQNSSDSHHAGRRNSGKYEPQE